MTNQSSFMNLFSLPAISELRKSAETPSTTRESFVTDIASDDCKEADAKKVTFVDVEMKDEESNKKEGLKDAKGEDKTPVKRMMTVVEADKLRQFGSTFNFNQQELRHGY